LVKIFRDETQVRNAMEALQQSRQELWDALQDNERARAEVEAAAAAKDQFLAVLSHELRTPLMPVVMTVHALRRRKDLPEELREALEIIERNVKLEVRFIDDLLDVTRISRGKLEIEREPLDFHDAVRHAIKIAQQDLADKSQTLTLSLDAKETHVIGDSSRLKQVVWNLVKNAAKFTPDKGAVSVSTRNEDGVIILEVKDNGIGIEPDAMARIFDAFTQESQAITRVYGGLGLGLAIAKATADAHGGTLIASSEGKGKGATFALRLPLAQE
jgi:signal transduction histidine kinase